jgi:hypothetical protein
LERLFAIFYFISRTKGHSANIKQPFRIFS